jgi:DNA adenine methylase
LTSSFGYRIMLGMNYPGGKGGVFHKLINLMPPHEVYIETHLGGGAIMRNRARAQRDIGIEIDPQVIEMWCQNKPIDFELIHDDAINYLKSYQFTGRELLYCDPPYLRKTRKKESGSINMTIPRSNTSSYWS